MGRMDRNQSQIVTALERGGCHVQSLHTVGGGCPDLLVTRDGNVYLLEVKYGSNGTSSLQRDWHEQCQVPVHVVKTAQGALAAVDLLCELPLPVAARPVHSPSIVMTQSTNEHEGRLRERFAFLASLEPGLAQLETDCMSFARLANAYKPERDYLQLQDTTVREVRVGMKLIAWHGGYSQGIPRGHVPFKKRMATFVGWQRKRPPAELRGMAPYDLGYAYLSGVVLGL